MLETSADRQREVSKFKVVLVGQCPAVLSPLDEALNAIRCESQSVPQGAFALDLIAGLGGVDLVVVFHPLADMEIDELVAALRADETRPVPTPMAVLTDEPEALASLTDSHCRVYSHEVPISELVSVLTGRVERAQRVAARLLVRLSLEKAGQEVLRLTQSENISRTGMLLRTQEDFPDNARAEFEFSVPGEDRPIAGEARIVRKSGVGSEALAAIAIHFESFRRSDLARFEAFLEQLVPKVGYRELSVGA